MEGYPPIAQLLPHGEPMVLLDQMQAWSPGRATCRFRVRDGARLVEDGRLETLFTIEHMAQAVAACLGYEAYRGGEGVRVGMIVSCREFEVFCDNAVVGDELEVTARRERGNRSLSHFACEVSRPSGSGEVVAVVDGDGAGDLGRTDSASGRLLARATLTLFHGESLIDEAATRSSES